MNDGGRLFFTNARRSIVDEDEIQITSVGIDIGSSTTHLAFSRITLERVDSQYIVAAREVLFESGILFTPYAGGNQIDTAALSAFFEAQYAAAGIGFDAIDTGALILTGTAVRRENARAIAEIFAKAAGKFVSISAGDGMEAVLAAHGAGAVALSTRLGAEILNIDIGGGTTKFARCAGGEVLEVTALDAGARIIALDADGRVIRLEPAGEAIAAACGVNISLGEVLSEAARETVAAYIAGLMMACLDPDAARQPVSLLRLEPLRLPALPARVTFSGGVSEYVYGRAESGHGDLGVPIARHITRLIAGAGAEILPAAQGIRATVIGASQYTVQVSGSTIFISDLSRLPLRNIPTLAPVLGLEADALDAEMITARIKAAMATAGIIDEASPFALGYSWAGSATFQRLNAFARGVAAGFASQLTRGLPLILVGDCDIGGLIGMHFAEELRAELGGSPIISIDGISSKQFDFIDIGAMLEGSGAVPVIIKSLVFPAGGALGQAGTAAA